MRLRLPPSIIAITDKLLNALITLVLFFLAAKIVPVASFGSFNYWLAVTTLAGPFVFLGMDGKISNDFAIKSGLELRDAFFAPLGVRLLMALVASAIILIFVADHASSTSADQIILLVALLMTLARVLDQYDLLFYSKGLILYPFLAKVFASILLAAGCLVFLLGNTNPLYFLGLIPCYPLLRNIFLIGCSIRLRIFGPPQATSLGLIARITLCGRWVRENLRIMIPLLLTSISIAIFMRIDQIILKSFVGEVELAKYGVAVKIADSLNLLGATLIAVRMPGILRANKDRVVFMQEIETLSSLLVWIALICMPITASFGFVLEHFFLPSEYHGLAIIVTIYACSSVFVYFGSLWSRWMIFEGNTMIMMYFQVTGMLANVALNFCLIPLWGCYGAAVATAVSSGLGHAVLAGFVKNQHEPFVVFYRSLFNGWRVVVREVFPKVV